MSDQRAVFVSPEFIDGDEMATPGPREVFLRSIEAGGCHRGGRYTG